MGADFIGGGINHISQDGQSTLFLEGTVIHVYEKLLAQAAYTFIEFRIFLPDDGKFIKNLFAALQAKEHIGRLNHLRGFDLVLVGVILVVVLGGIILADLLDKSTDSGIVVKLLKFVKSLFAHRFILSYEA